MEDVVENRKMLREVTTVSRLYHRHIVRYYQAWLEGGVESDTESGSEDEDEEWSSDEEDSDEDSDESESEYSTSDEDSDWLVKTSRSSGVGDNDRLNL